jgi:hypothetical protein
MATIFNARLEGDLDDLSVHYVVQKPRLSGGRRDAYTRFFSFAAYLGLRMMCNLLHAEV